jgi:hypothetical protein
MDKKIYFIVDDGTRSNRAHIYHDGIKPAPAGYKVTIEEAAKSRDMECKYHAMCGDIAKVCTFMGRKWDLESWKRILIESFVQVMREEAIANGKPDPFPEKGMSVPSLDGKRIVQLGVQSRGFSKSIGSEFISYLYAYGAEHDVVWSDTSMHYIQEMRG